METELTPNGNNLLATVEEGVRSQESGVRRENCMGIVFDKPLRVYAPPNNFEHRVDGGILNP
ncbi:MAG: hypothetical protein F6K18_22895 [Okeania sp. SIO2C2]|uniref:hypothetical protein n=1 Tax=Okeania sp. SIO2C2 TaxID=2607787 RepID=UPI0013B6B6E1|nr:hypothetical protein [Okeania sp. SIO2C2]NEP89446.1 hypothetical protein [Okeania sp. SIO2C2]